MEIFDLILDVLKNTLTITSLVMVMLLLIEFVNVTSSGRLMEKLQHKPLAQITIAALLGLIPGCIGGFAVVSLFTHNLISFGAMIAGMITTFGDEAFFLFAYSPKWALTLSAILFVLALLIGAVIHYTARKKYKPAEKHIFEIHGDEMHSDHTDVNLSFKNLKNLSFSRALLLFSLIAYLLFQLTGALSHNHSMLPEFKHNSSNQVTSLTSDSHGFDEECVQDHDHSNHHEHADAHPHIHGEDTFHWENLIFILLTLITLVIVAFSSEHFLHSHLWEHVIKKHFLSILLCTFFVLLILHFLYYFVDVNNWIQSNDWAKILILLLAILIGIIPESGPHLVFIVLFLNGTIPFSILLSNSIVQDGHGALPLLAESRKSFIVMKIIKIAVALIIGFAGLGMNF